MGRQWGIRGQEGNKQLLGQTMGWNKRSKVFTDVKVSRKRTEPKRNKSKKGLVFPLWLWSSTYLQPINRKSGREEGIEQSIRRNKTDK